MHHEELQALFMDAEEPALVGVIGALLRRECVRPESARLRHIGVFVPFANNARLARAVGRVEVHLRSVQLECMQTHSEKDFIPAKSSHRIHASAASE